jgi:hypothetical protein
MTIDTDSTFALRCRTDGAIESEEEVAINSHSPGTTAHLELVLGKSNGERTAPQLATCPSGLRFSTAPTGIRRGSAENGFRVNGEPRTVAQLRSEIERLDGYTADGFVRQHLSVGRFNPATLNTLRAARRAFEGSAGSTFCC